MSSPLTVLAADLDAARVADAAKDARIAALEAQLAARFPGDPGPGRILVGAIVSGGAGDADTFEAAAGAKLGTHRAYFRAGISDFDPNGPMLAFIKAEHAAGRVPVVSAKPGRWPDIVAGKFDAQFAAFRDAVESLPKVTRVIVNHEPQNDTATLGTPADFRAAQARLRRIFGPRPRRLSFGGSLMTYGWTPPGLAKFGPVDAWFPGTGVWDWCGLDQYAQNVGDPVDDKQFEAALASLRAWGVVPGITEVGVRSADPNGPALLSALFDKAVSLGFASFEFYNSDRNSTGNGWVLTGALRDRFAGLLNDPRAARPNA